MARFYATVSGRGENTATKTGTTDSGINAHIRGWDVGIKVEGDARSEDDRFEAYITAGSNGGMAYGPVFIVHTQGHDGLRIVNLAEEFGGGTFVIDQHGQVWRIEDDEYDDDES